MRAKKNSWLAFIAMLIAACLFLTSCGGNQPEGSRDSIATENSMPATTITQLVETIVPTDAPTSTPEVTPTLVPTATPVTDGLSDEQRNSIGMLNYLTMLTQEINSSTNSRLYLENAFSSLVNNTYPNAVDQQTEMHLEEILEGLKDYRMNSVKRERLEYIYERNKAQAIRAAVPNPVGLLSSVGSFSWPKLIASVAYMAVDSITSYQNATSQAELQYLQDGWALDDAEYETLEKMRSGAFTYMLEMVNAYNLPGDLALNEKSVDNYVKWKNEGNVIRRIQMFEANKKTYQGFGPYWLTLAESYYTNGDYQKCIDAIESYEALTTRIFRQDYELAKILPSAFLAAMEVLDGDAFISIAEHYLDLLETNADYEDWSLRYFAAQGYLELYQRTKNELYLSKAYDLVLNNATLLVSEQLNLNSDYLADVKKISIPNGSVDEKKKEIEKINKQAEEDRKTALVPTSEPLILNCDLLFSIADILDIPASEEAKIESILHHNAQPLFLIPAIDNRYWFREMTLPSTDSIEVEFKDNIFTIPVECISESGTVLLTIKSADKITTIKDFTLTKVERRDKNDISTFYASYSSPTASKYQFKKDDQLLFNIITDADEAESNYQFSFIAEERTNWIVNHYLVYVRTEGTK